MQILLRDDRVDPNAVNRRGHDALRGAAVFSRDAMSNSGDADDEVGAAGGAAERFHPAAVNIAQAVLANGRSNRLRPPATLPSERRLFDEALRNVKRPRAARFRGLVLAAVAFRRMRLRAARAVYAPGGSGFAAAAASFDVARRCYFHRTSTGESPAAVEVSKRH